MLTSSSRQFDLCMSETLREKVRVKSTIKGRLHVYRFCDDVWTFVVSKPTLKLNSGEVIEPNIIKVVACTAKGASLGV